MNCLKIKGGWKLRSEVLGRVGIKIAQEIPNPEGAPEEWALNGAKGCLGLQPVIPPPHREEVAGDGSLGLGESRRGCVGPDGGALATWLLGSKDGRGLEPLII